MYRWIGWGIAASVVIICLFTLPRPHPLIGFMWGLGMGYMGYNTGKAFDDTP